MPAQILEVRWDHLKAHEFRTRATEAAIVLVPVAAIEQHERTASGALGDPTAASAEKGERLLEAAAAAVAELLLNDRFWGGAGSPRTLFAGARV
jgi:creatinine amidohydrolase/Fe(II)-dependent formamide hydrolase-like protein